MEKELFRVQQPRDWGTQRVWGSESGFIPPSSEQSLGPLWHPTTLTTDSPEGKDRHTLPFPKHRDEALLPKHTLLQWPSSLAGLDQRSPCLSEGLAENSWVAFPHKPYRHLQSLERVMESLPGVRSSAAQTDDLEITALSLYGSLWRHATEQPLGQWKTTLQWGTALGRRKPDSTMLNELIHLL